MRLRSRFVEDLLPGGLGDDRKLSDFDFREVEIGLCDETEEHGALAAPEVVADHLTKDPKYYTRKQA